MRSIASMAGGWLAALLALAGCAHTAPGAVPAQTAAPAGSARGGRPARLSRAPWQTGGARASGGSGGWWARGA